MKKGLKIVGAVAGLTALAALVPYSCKKDEESDTLTLKALLWKYTNQPDSNTDNSRKVTIDIGFHNPFAIENDDLLMDEEDELILVDAPACDIELTLEPKLDDEPATPMEAEENPAVLQPETY